MAIIKCINCGHEISDTTKKCIHCGKKIKKASKKREYQLKTENNDINNVEKEKTIKKNKFKRKLKVGKVYKILIVILFIIIVVICSSLLVLKKYNDRFVTIEFKYDKSCKVLKVEKGDTIQSLNIKNKKGYMFDGWYLNNKKYNFNKKVTSDIILKGKWLKVYKISFNSDGGISINSQEVTKGEKVTRPDNPTKDGYDFLNWYLDDKEYDFNNKVNSNITLIAKWKEQVAESTVVDDIDNSNFYNSKLPSQSNKCTNEYQILKSNEVIYPVNGYYQLNVGDYINLTRSDMSIGDNSFSSNAPDLLQQSYNITFYAKGSGIATITISCNDSSIESRHYMFLINE